MAVFAPGDNPRISADPRDYPGLDPGMWARLRDFASGFNPIGSAQAAETPPPPQGPMDQAIALGQNAPTGQAGILPHLFGRGGNQPILPYIFGGPAAEPGPGTPSGVGIGSDAKSPLGTAPTPWFTSSNTPLPWRGPGATPATTVASAPLPPPRPPGLGIAPGMQGVVPPSNVQPVNSPFKTLDYRPNADVAGGALSRGGPPQMSALDLSGLFGGGAQAAVPAAPAMKPRTKINVGKIPPEMRAEVRPKKKFKSSTTSQGGGY